MRFCHIGFFVFYLIKAMFPPFRSIAFRCQRFTINTGLLEQQKILYGSLRHRLSRPWYRSKTTTTDVGDSINFQILSDRANTVGSSKRWTEWARQMALLVVDAVSPHIATAIIERTSRTKRFVHHNNMI